MGKAFVKRGKTSMILTAIVFLNYLAEKAPHTIFAVL